jgi:hypothetical protein
LKPAVLLHSVLAGTEKAVRKAPGRGSEVQQERSEAERGSWTASPSQEERQTQNKMIKERKKDYTGSAGMWVEGALSSSIFELNFFYLFFLICNYIQI